MSQKQGQQSFHAKPTTGNAPALQIWQIRLARRLGMLDAPGVYPLVLIVDDQGRRSIVVQSGQAEELGHGG